MTAGIQAVHVLIMGRVQGVGYRAWVAREANAAGLSGWVRNLSSGDVEAVLSGPPGKVADMLERCWRGPSWARVADVKLVSDAQPIDGAFEVRADA